MRNKNPLSYRQVTDSSGDLARLHVVRAEKALGHKLPKGAVVHHADGSKRDDAPLVICQDQEYHFFLHIRMRTRAAGGNPNTDAVCCSCHAAKALSEFHRERGGRMGVCAKCKKCVSEQRQARRVMARQMGSLSPGVLLGQ